MTERHAHPARRPAASKPRQTARICKTDQFKLKRSRNHHGQPLDQFTTTHWKALATMAQTDAMETAKEVLRQIIKYRFWISIGVAALFAVIAYAVGSGPIREAAAKETSTIIGAEKEVQTYRSPSIPTPEYKPIVEEKTKVVSKDVTIAWQTLYERQAGLLTWPEGVQERFQTWGKKWPENVKPDKIELAIVDYIEAYPAYVNMVYKTFDPFDYETGEGVVVAPSEAELLLPVKFSQEHLPDMGKIWAAQERLWIQRTVLEVIAEVNKSAKKWDEAVIRQIISLDVGNSDAQDQRSIAKSETLEESKGIYPPGEEPVADASGGATTSTVSQPGGGRLGGAMGAAAARGAGGMMGGGMGMGMGGMGANTAPQSVFYVKSDSDKYKVLPLVVTVLIDQDRVQDFLIELENSRMSVQVKDFELMRPATRVAKPEKGDAGSSFAMMSGMMGGRMGGGMMGGMIGMGGMANQMEQQMQSMMQTQRAAMGSAGMNMMSMPGGGMSGQPAAKKKTGKDVRNTKRAEVRDKEGKALDKNTGPSLFDAFFDIVQVKVYGQARFFNAPPADAVADASSGDTATGAATAPADKAAKGGETQPKTPAQADAGEKAAAPPKAAADAVAPDAKDAADAKDASPAAKPAAPDAKSNPEKAKSTDDAEDADEPAKPANPPAPKTDPAKTKGSEAKP
jgi:hypothetical protein